MTIARDSNSTPTSASNRALGHRGRVDGSFHGEEDASLIPVEIRLERLDAQIRSFERAGYRLETRAGMQAIVTKRRERRPLRDGALAIGTLGLALVPSILGVRPIYHRVVITVDAGGAVRLA